VLITDSCIEYHDLQTTHKPGGVGRCGRMTKQEDHETPQMNVGGCYRLISIAVTLGGTISNFSSPEASIGSQGVCVNPFVVG